MDRLTDLGIFCELQLPESQIHVDAEVAVQINGWGREPYTILSVDRAARTVSLQHKYDSQEFWLANPASVPFTSLKLLLEEDDVRGGADMARELQAMMQRRA